MEEPKLLKPSRWDWPFIISAGIVAFIGVLLTRGAMNALFGLPGNPVNMGLCMNCFLRDVAGSLGMHKAKIAWYFRPEIPGLLLGALLASVLLKEFKPRGGENGMVRFFFGAFMGFGAMMFLGCTTRMGLRLGGGDMNALVAFAGFAAGVYVGTLFLKKGYSAGDKSEAVPVTGLILPFLVLVLFVAFLIFGLNIFGIESIKADNSVFKFTERLDREAFPKPLQAEKIFSIIPGKLHAHWYLAIILALVAGMVAYWGRLCFMRPFRDLFLTKSGRLLGGILVFVLVATIFNVIIGQYKLGFTNQVNIERLAHASVLCNLLGMFAVGLSAVFLDGCPLRQVIKAGSGNLDSGVTVMGIIAAVALADNLGFSCKPKVQSFTAGVAVDIGIGTMLVVAFFSSEYWTKTREWIKSR